MKSELHIEVITSPANPRVKYLRKLGQKKNDLGDGKFLIMGKHHIGSAVEADWHVSEVYFTAEIPDSDFGSEILQKVAEIGGALFEVPKEIFRNISEKEYDHGLVAVCEKRELDLNAIAGVDHIIALVAPQDPGNVGTILRTLDSVGGGALVMLDGGIKPYHPTFLRASMGSIFWDPVVSCSFEEFDRWRVKNGYKMFGTSAKGQPIDQYRKNADKTILLFGSEQKGLDADHIASCDQMITLPMRGHHSSLNIAVAAGIIMYKIFENN